MMPSINPFKGSSAKLGRWKATGKDPFHQKKSIVRGIPWWPCYYDLHEDLNGWVATYRAPALKTPAAVGDYAIGWRGDLRYRTYASKSITYPGCDPDWILSCYVYINEQNWSYYQQFCILLAQHLDKNLLKKNGFTVERWGSGDSRGEIRKVTINGISASFGGSIGPLEIDKWYYVEAHNLPGDTKVYVWDPATWGLVGSSTFGAAQDTTIYIYHQALGFGTTDGNTWDIWIDQTRVLQPVDGGIFPPKIPGKKY